MDSLGEALKPTDGYYGAQTQLADNVRISVGDVTLIGNMLWLGFSD